MEIAHFERTRHLQWQLERASPAWLCVSMLSGVSEDGRSVSRESIPEFLAYLYREKDPSWPPNRPYSNGEEESRSSAGGPGSSTCSSRPRMEALWWHLSVDDFASPSGSGSTIVHARYCILYHFPLACQVRTGNTLLVPNADVQASPSRFIFCYLFSYTHWNALIPECKRKEISKHKRRDVGGREVCLAGEYSWISGISLPRERP